MFITKKNGVAISRSVSRVNEFLHWVTFNEAFYSSATHDSPDKKCKLGLIKSNRIIKVQTINQSPNQHFLNGNRQSTALFVITPTVAIVECQVEYNLISVRRGAVITRPFFSPAFVIDIRTRYKVWLWLKPLTKLPHQWLLYRVQYQAILHRVITEPDCTVQIVARFYSGYIYLDTAMQLLQFKQNLWRIRCMDFIWKNVSLSSTDLVIYVPVISNHRA